MLEFATLGFGFGAVGFGFRGRRRGLSKGGNPSASPKKPGVGPFSFLFLVFRVGVPKKPGVGPFSFFLVFRVGVP